jgi:hypothetical protein
MPAACASACEKSAQYMAVSTLACMPSANGVPLSPHVRAAARLRSRRPAPGGKKSDGAIAPELGFSSVASNNERSVLVWVRASGNNNGRSCTSPAKDCSWSTHFVYV